MGTKKSPATTSAKKTKTKKVRTTSARTPEKVTPKAKPAASAYKSTAKKVKTARKKTVTPRKKTTKKYGPSKAIASPKTRKPPSMANKKRTPGVPVRKTKKKNSLPIATLLGDAYVFTEE